MGAFGRPKYAKIASFGSQGSGKTFSNILLAAGLHKEIGCKRPLKVFDSEGGLAYQLDRVLAMTGHEPEGRQARSFVDLMEFCHLVEPGDVVLIDSVSQPWSELLAAKQKKMGRMRGLMSAKEDWQGQFTSWLLSFPAHVFVCGRAGVVFEERIDEVTGEREISAVDTKLKAEGDFGYEPSLLLEWERVQKSNGSNGHECIVRKDRFGIIDGRRSVFSASERLLGSPSAKPDYDYNPVYAEFKVWFDKLDLHSGGETGIDTTPRTALILNSDGYSKRQAEEVERKVLLAEIADDMQLAYPGQSKEEKTARIELAREVFGAGVSWERIEANIDEMWPAARLRGARIKLGECIVARQKPKREDVK